MVDMDAKISELIQKARNASEQAYAPYSKFRVGAALLTTTGKIYTGCNVEFADYLALHAEVNAIGSAVNDGENDIRIIVIFSYSSPPVLPCGSCRQKLTEFSKLHNHDILVIVVNDQDERNKYLLSSLLPSSDIPVVIED